MPPFSLRTFLNPRSSLITAPNIIPCNPFPSLSLYPAVRTPLPPLSISFSSCHCALHLATSLGLECPGGFIFSTSLWYWPFPSPRYTCAPAHTHTHLQSHMLVDILRSLPMDLIFIAAQTKKEPNIFTL